MPIRRKSNTRTSSHRSAHSGVLRGDLMKANLKRFHELIERSQAVTAPAAAKPTPPSASSLRVAQPEQPAAPARPPVGEVISPPRGGRSGVSGVRMAQAGRQVRGSVSEARDLLREEASQLLASHQGMEQIVEAAHRIADLAVCGVQRTGEIAEIVTAAALYEAQRKKMQPDSHAACPDADVPPPATQA
jgi:hypothetical protein